MNSIMMKLGLKEWAMLMSSALELHEVRNEFSCVAAGTVIKQQTNRMR